MPPAEGSDPTPPLNQMTGSEASSDFAPPIGYDSAASGYPPALNSMRGRPVRSRLSIGGVLGKAALGMGLWVGIGMVGLLIAHTVFGIGTSAPPPVALAQLSSKGAVPGQGEELSTPTFGIRVLPGWQVQERREQPLVLTDQREGGVVLIRASRSDQPVTTNQLFSGFESTLREEYPDLGSCGSEQRLSIDGKLGEVRGYSYTVQQVGGREIPLCSLVWLGVNSNGTTVYEWEQLSPFSLAQALEVEAIAERGTLEWKV
ncbi:MAG: hypothetical protein ACREP9_13340 [Candidatus Dormibacteraceae bacterium]